MQSRDISVVSIILILGMGAYLFSRWGGHLVQDTAGVRKKLQGPWYCQFRLDEQVRNISQTEWMKLTFEHDGSCLFEFSANEVIRTMGVSEDGKSRDIGSGYVRNQNSFKAKYRLDPDWQGIKLTLIFPGKTFYSSSFEPFLVTKKPDKDFTDPYSEVEVSADLSMQGEYLSLKAKNKVIVFARPQKEYINFDPLVRTGVASGDRSYRQQASRMLIKDGAGVQQGGRLKKFESIGEVSNRIIRK